MGFLGSLFGGDQKKALKQAKGKADAALSEGYGQAQNYYNQGFDQLTPYANGGLNAQTRYNDLLGLNGDAARSAGQQTYQSDPMFSAVLGDQSNALLRQQNARGGIYNGTAVQAAGRLGLQNYQNYLGQLQGQGSQGLGAATNQAQIRSGQGDSAFNYGATRASNEIGYGNARAQASQGGVNNLLNLGSTVLKGAALFSDARLKRNVERVGTMPSGLPLHEFEYIWGPEKFVGVLAQEALAYRPEAVSMDDSGFLKVNYSLL